MKELNLKQDFAQYDLEETKIRLYNLVRDRRDLTDARLAEMLGISRQAVNNFWNPKKVLSLEAAFALSRILGVSLDEVIVCHMAA